MTDMTDTFWFHNCEERKVWIPKGAPCILCGITEQEADSAWRKGTIWEDK